jgi:tRNA-specific 2-thiouridylase
MSKQYKAVALYSGGLDSLLSMKLLTNQGIEVVALHIETGFGGRNDEAKAEYLERAVAQTGATLKIVDIKEQFVKEVLFDPKYGYGKNFNPCIDCHGNMFRVAHEVMKQEGADFLISGEVIGQRPMSQRVEAMNQVVKLSGVDDLILRPMSAKLMAPTKPEREDWVDREQLLDINGRGRNRQLELAKAFGIVEYESPAGGCLLTDESYSNKIKDHIDHESFEVADINLLKFGRHLRLSNGSKMIIGRNHEENLKLLEIENPKYIKVDIGDLKGPVVLISADYHDNDLQDILDLTVTYSKSEEGVKYPIEISEQTHYGQKRYTKEDAQKYFIN